MTDNHRAARNHLPSLRERQDRSTRNATLAALLRALPAEDVSNQITSVLGDRHDFTAEQLYRINQPLANLLWETV